MARRKYKETKRGIDKTEKERSQKKKKKWKEEKINGETDTFDAKTTSENRKEIWKKE